MQSDYGQKQGSKTLWIIMPRQPHTSRLFKSTAGIISGKVIASVLRRESASETAATFK